MSIDHHADAATLMSYSSGTLGEALSAVVAGHVAMCKHCRSELARMDDIGSALLTALPGSSLANPAPRPSAGDISIAPAAALNEGAASDIPAPLTRLAGTKLDSIAWKRLGLGVRHARLPLSAQAKGDLRLIKIAPGQMMPEHGHGGSEMTLVLQGSYTDRLGRFSSGDIADLDDGVEHQPVADPVTGCICLIASEEKARFKGLFARIVQPLVGL